jgi:hypothetical protein
VIASKVGRAPRSEERSDVGRHSEVSLYQGECGDDDAFERGDGSDQQGQACDSCYRSRLISGDALCGHRALFRSGSEGLLDTTKRRPSKSPEGLWHWVYRSVR